MKKDIQRSVLDINRFDIHACPFFDYVSLPNGVWNYMCNSLKSKSSLMLLPPGRSFSWPGHLLILLAKLLGRNFRGRCGRKRFWGTKFHHIHRLGFEVVSRRFLDLQVFSTCACFFWYFHLYMESRMARIVQPFNGNFIWYIIWNIIIWNISYNV